VVRINFETRLLETRIELSGLTHARELMEKQIQLLCEERRKEAGAQVRELANQGVEWEDGEIQLVFQERDYAIEHLYPRLFRGPFLVTLWAIYEAGLKEVARFVKRAKNIDLDIDEISGHDVRRKARRYFEAVLQVTFGTGSSRAGDIGKVYKVRNAFAHANGRLRSLTPDVLRTVVSMIAEGHLEETLGYIVPTDRYVAAASEVIHTELSGLVDEAIRWHNSSSGGAPSE
jgi:hypothetical protein